MTILIFSPRIHNNLIFPIKLLSRNHKVLTATQLKKYELNGPEHLLLQKNKILTAILSILFFNKKSTFYFFPKILKTFLLLNRVNADVVIIRDKSIFSLIITILNSISSRSIIILYDQSPYMRSDFMRLNYKFSRLLFPYQRITPVEFRKDEALFNKKLLKDANSLFVPFVSERNHEFSRHYFADGKINILIVGKFMEFKNLIYAVDEVAVARYKEGIVLRMVGESSQENKILNLVRDKQKQLVNDLDIEILINKSRNEMIELYLKSDILIIPSSRDIAPFAIVEAMSYGLCILASIYCGTASYISDSQNGYTFDSKVKGELSKHLDYLMDNRSIIKKMGLVSGEIWSKNHNGTQFLESLRGICNGE